MPICHLKGSFLFSMGKKRNKGKQNITRLSKGYTSTNKKHTGRAVMSAVFGVMCLFFLVLASFMAYKMKGLVPVGFGFTGLFATIFSGIGMYLGVTAVKDDSNYKLFGILGVVTNGLTLGGISLILYMGSYMVS